MSQNKCQLLKLSAIKILPKHTHVYTAIASSLRGERSAKHYKPAVCISTNSYPLKSTLHNATLNNASAPPFQFSNHVSARSRFYGVISPLYFYNTY